MIPNNGDVYNFVRSLLGDTEVASGQIFTDDFQREYLQSAYEEMIRALGLQDSSFLRRHAHFNLPAHQSYLAPSQMGLTNFGEPKFVYERAVDQEFAITDFTPDSSDPQAFCDLTTAAHGLTSADDGKVVVIWGLQPAVDAIAEGEWAATFPDGTTIRLLGCNASEDASNPYTSGGKVSWSNEDWSEELDAVNDILDLDMDETADLGQYAWRGDAFIFSPSSNQRQLKIVYTPSGSIGPGKYSSLFIDDSRDFLARRTAGQCALAKGGNLRGRGMQLNAEAIGPRLDIEHPGGLLGDMINHRVKSLQRNEYPILPFRERTSTGLPGYQDYYGG